ncbi:hypothetical protein EMPG_17233 [Blastomyces silverae]|uniref:Uncharacterized protein n=1 Tax=Blastomyces silverae TaxID=2060906 RepID=A0A0H1BDM8_9EURO|nr:hypothetical protein EMPG_17233 [Blastomyces silverae]
MRFSGLPNINITLSSIIGENVLTSIAGGILRASGRYFQENPYQLATGTVLIATSIVATPALGVIGFTPIGPAAGTVATAWQSGIGSVEAGSLFARCQSAAMGGVAAKAVTAVGAAGAGVAALPAVSKTVGAVDLEVNSKEMPMERGLEIVGREEMFRLQTGAEPRSERVRVNMIRRSRSEILRESLVKIKGTGYFVSMENAYKRAEELMRLVGERDELRHSSGAQPPKVSSSLQARNLKGGDENVEESRNSIWRH